MPKVNEITEECSFIFVVENIYMVFLMSSNILRNFRNAYTESYTNSL